MGLFLFKIVSEMENVRVAAGIIFKNERQFLIARRKPEKSLGGYWEFPGGKVEQFESIENALKREIKEELNIQISTINKIAEFEYHIENRCLQFFCFECLSNEIPTSLTDHDLIEWITLDDLPSYKLAPADIIIASYIKKKQATD